MANGMVMVGKSPKAISLRWAKQDMRGKTVIAEPPIEKMESLSPEETKCEAIKKIAESNRTFIEAAVGVIRGLALRRREFSSMDVWTHYHGPQPTSPRAIGAAFVQAQSLAIIEPTARYVKSGRRSDHNQLLRVWRSCIYQRQPMAAVPDQASLF